MPGSWRLAPSHGATPIEPWSSPARQWRWHPISRSIAIPWAWCYGVGRYSEAIHVLERSPRADRNEPDAFDLFFLAMAQHGLSHSAQARSCFNQAVRWLAGRQNLSPQEVQELAAFRAEAEAVLAYPVLNYRPTCSRPGNRLPPETSVQSQPASRSSHSRSAPHHDDDHFFESVCRLGPFRQLLLYGVAQVGPSNRRGRPAMPHPRRRPTTAW